MSDTGGMGNSESARRRRGALLVAAITGLFMLTGCASPSRPHPADGLTIAAAADLKYALDEVIHEYRSIHPQSVVRVSYGSSGTFFAQLSNRAPFDLFLSADLAYPRELAKRGLVLEGTEFTYAVGRIVLWVPSASKLDLEHSGVAVLRDPAVRHVAIANPQHAPYGRAAEAALRSLGVWDAVQAKLVLGENIAQTLQFVENGAADAGVIALSLALAPPLAGKGRYWEIPLAAYPRIEQGGVILKWASNVEQARRFREFLLSERGRAVLKRYGFFLP